MRLARACGGGPVRTTLDVIRKFASLQTPQMSASEHYTAFVRWLCIKGIVNYKDDITIAVAAKSYLLLILLYLHARYFSIAIEPPE